jgi:hypothetical protein
MLPGTHYGSLAGVIASFILERPLCASCVARKASATEPEVLQAIDAMTRLVKLKIGSWERCRSCALIGYTYSLTRV